MDIPNSLGNLFGDIMGKVEHPHYAPTDLREICSLVRELVRKEHPIRTEDIVNRINTEYSIPKEDIRHAVREIAAEMIYVMHNGWELL